MIWKRSKPDKTQGISYCLHGQMTIDGCHRTSSTVIFVVII